ncbi:radical SAM protein [candidate division KSB1 bacterium]
MNKPAYLELHNTGELAKRASVLQESLKPCNICPHICSVDRTAGELGICGAPGQLYVSSIFPHFGEEAPLVGIHGSGTVFLTYCNLRCVFCQNNDISHGGVGRIYEVQDLALDMLKLQKIGCHNINFVTPTHYVPQIIDAVAIAADNGLCVPLVYNTSAYDSVETLKLLDGIVDIYMPDMKFADNETGSRYTQADNYADIMFKAVMEMHNQVGDLYINSDGIAVRGLLIRHLVMPNDVSSSERIFKFISDEISIESYVNVMDQYRPCYNAGEFSGINRRVSFNELSNAKKAAKKAGLYRGFA